MIGSYLWWDHFWPEEGSPWPVATSHPLVVAAPVVFFVVVLVASIIRHPEVYVLLFAVLLYFFLAMVLCMGVSRIFGWA